MTVTTVNAVALERTMTFIEENRDRWDQNYWTTCFAGWTVRLAAQDNPQDYVLLSETLIATRATAILGIDPIWRGRLFYAHNTIEDLRAMVNYLIGVQIPADASALDQESVLVGV